MYEGMCIDTLSKCRNVLDVKYTHIRRNLIVDVFGIQDFLIVIALSTKLDLPASVKLRLKSVGRKGFTFRNMTMLCRVWEVSFWMKARIN
jgi:hypothetical protein